jgi:hypothetical protein
MAAVAGTRWNQMIRSFYHRLAAGKTKRSAQAACMPKPVFIPEAGFNKINPKINLSPEPFD